MYPPGFFFVVRRTMHISLSSIRMNDYPWSNSNGMWGGGLVPWFDLLQSKPKHLEMVSAVHTMTEYSPCYTH